MSRRKKSFSRLSRRGKNCIKEYLSNLKTHFEALNYNSQLLEPFIAGNFLRAQKKFPFDKSSPQLNTFVGVELPFKKLWNDSQLLFSPLVRGEERKVNYGEKTSPPKRDTCFGTHKFASFFLLLLDGCCSAGRSGKYMNLCFYLTFPWRSLIKKNFREILDLGRSLCNVTTKGMKMMKDISNVRLGWDG